MCAAEGAEVLFSDIETNGIAYLNFYFDASAVPQQEIPYLYLLAGFLGMVDTEEHTYAELANLRNLHTGGITADVIAYTKKDQPDSPMPRLRVRAKVLVEKLPSSWEIL